MKQIFLGVFSFLSFGLIAQQTGQWTAHTPFNTVNDIAVKGSRYFCASNQGIFEYDALNQEINTYSKLNGLNDIGINAIAYNAENDLLIVGYRNANIDLLTGSNVFNMSDIKRSSSYIGLKRINHIITQGDFAWLSTGFGIVKINLTNLVVEETYIIGPNGSTLEVFETAIDADNDLIYAATPDGLYSADMNQPLIFFQFWQKDTILSQGEINHVATLNGRVFANKVTAGSVEDTVFYNEGSGWTYLPEQGINKKLDMRAVNGYLCIANPFTVNFLDQDLNIDYVIGPSFYEPGTFQPLSAYMMPDGFTMLIGNENHGLIISENVSTNSRILPNGPFTSDAYGLAAQDGRAYVAPGAINEIWTNEFLNFGIYTLNDFEWGRIEPDEVNNIGDIINILIDPADNTHIYAAAWGQGLLELRNGVLENVWDNTTTGGAIQGPPGDETTVRTGDAAYDIDGNLWVTSSLSERPLSVQRTDGTWESYSAGSLAGSTTNVLKILVNRLNQKWVQTRTRGLLVMDDDRDGQIRFNRVTQGSGQGNLPNNSVLDFDEDLDGDMWIGTTEGLVVCYSPQNVFQNGKNFDAQPILFEEDGVVQRLLGTEAVNAVAVDGANKKWFGTLGSGVFYTSADGTETIYNFTEDNSPLLSNTILDIAIDDETGEVYFATAEGIVSFRGSATRGFDDYTDVFAYPNPVRPGYDGPIYIRGLVTNARVKITDVAGNIVFETVAEGGQARWDGQNLNGEKVVSGVYLAYITDDLAEKTTVTKILVIR